MLIFACPPGVPRARGLDLLWTDYREHCKWKGYSSTCLRFTLDRLHVGKTHWHINGQAADIRRLTSFCYLCAQATFNAENLESVWVLGCVGALHSLYEVMYSAGRYPHVPCILPGNYFRKTCRKQLHDRVWLNSPDKPIITIRRVYA